MKFLKYLVPYANEVRHCHWWTLNSNKMQTIKNENFGCAFLCWVYWCIDVLHVQVLIKLIGSSSTKNCILCLDVLPWCIIFTPLLIKWSVSLFFSAWVTLFYWFLQDSYEEILANRIPPKLVQNYNFFFHCHANVKWIGFIYTADTNTSFIVKMIDFRQNNKHWRKIKC